MSNNIEKAARLINLSDLDERIGRVLRDASDISMRIHGCAYLLMGHANDKEPEETPQPPEAIVIRLSALIGQIEEIQARQRQGLQYIEDAIREEPRTRPDIDTEESASAVVERLARERKATSQYARERGR